MVGLFQAATQHLCVVGFGKEEQAEHVRRLVNRFTFAELEDEIGAERQRLAMTEGDFRPMLGLPVPNPCRRETARFN